MVTSDVDAYGGPVKIAFQNNGQVVVVADTFFYATSADYPFNASAKLVLWQFNDDGSPDSTFGSGGLVATDPGGRMFVQFEDMALQPDGKIVVLGDSILPTNTTNFTTSDLTLVRFSDDSGQTPGSGDSGQPTLPVQPMVGPVVPPREPTHRIACCSPGSPPIVMPVTAPVTPLGLLRVPRRGLPTTPRSAASSGMTPTTTAASTPGNNHWPG